MYIIKFDANHSKYIKYHGTIVAGMIAAAQNGKYTSGISPNVTLLPISHNLESSETLSEELATGISWAWRNGAHIINNSWGDGAGVYYDVLHSALLEEAIHDAMNEGRNGFGSIVTFASGNHNFINYPAYANDSIICVGSINQSFQWFEGSGYGEKLDVVAPGGQLLGTVPWYEGNVYPDASGTSFACPHVSGLAALMLTVNPLLNVEQLQATIDSTCVKLDGYGYGITYPYGSWNSKTGYGLIDAGRAVQAAKDLLPQLKVSEIIRYNDRRVGGWVILDVMGLKVPEICDVEWTIANQDMCNIESYTVEMVGREYFIMEIKGNGLGVIPPFDVEAKYVMNGNVPSTKIIGGGGKKEVYSMRAHVPIGFSLPYYSLEGNIVSQELTIKKSIKGTKEKVGDVSSLRVEIYSLQNKVKTVEVDPLSKEIKISVSDLPDGNYMQASGQTISGFADFIGALEHRHDFFAAQGCRLSDHGLSEFYAEDYTEDDIRRIYNKVYGGKHLDEAECARFKSAMLVEFARMDAEKGWTQQFHYGTIRNANSRMMRLLGPDTGFDSIGEFSTALSMARFLDRLDSRGILPQTILYNLNPAANEMVATMIGNFQDGSVPGKIQFGSGWWFNDQKDGMERQMNALSVLGLLSRFVGMLTDSRSFLSYPRHEYFRRTFCNLLGRDVENGEMPVGEMPRIRQMVEDICYYNARNYFRF